MNNLYFFLLLYHLYFFLINFQHQFIIAMNDYLFLLLLQILITFMITNQYYFNENHKNILNHLNYALINLIILFNY